MNADERRSRDAVPANRYRNPRVSFWAAVAMCAITVFSVWCTFQQVMQSHQSGQRLRELKEQLIADFKHQQDADVQVEPD
jgi:cytochrome c-type biogenesis protein CcmH/NrfG